MTTSDSAGPKKPGRARRRSKRSFRIVWWESLLCEATVTCEDPGDIIGLWDRRMFKRGSHRAIDRLIETSDDELEVYEIQPDGTEVCLTPKNLPALRLPPFD